ncbi:MAG TPA: hypothetical protein VNN73_03660 [Blastocatellia bacterium]|nr:hypothetical protein [Blastocatellia bacterium]
MFEILFEFILEILIQVLAEMGLHSVGEVFHKREERNPFFAFLGYGLLGLIAGGLSLIFFLARLSEARDFMA